MSNINTVNPYANHSQLSTLEADVLWEFAKLNDKIKRASALARETAENPNESLLAELRSLEKRMGLVLTLVQASVWAVIVDSQAAEEARAQHEHDHGHEYEHSVQGGAPERSYDETRSWQDSIMR
ncbi:hypothetical protein IAT38_000444 [Cryptococcus sp. DSM 104549]